MESLLRHDLKEVRVHDSSQATKLARQLGGEAFTIGTHVFGPFKELAASTSEGAGLLAHEITHVIQQTRPRELTWDTPTRRLLVPTPAKHRGQPPVASSIHNRPSKSPSSTNNNTQAPEGGMIQLSISSDAHGGAIQRKDEEIQAQTTEQAVKEAVQTGSEAAKSPKTAQADPEAIASMVYRMILRDLVLEQERR
jgi:hypothetical protein